MRVRVRSAWRLVGKKSGTKIRWISSESPPLCGDFTKPLNRSFPSNALPRILGGGSISLAQKTPPLFAGEDRAWLPTGANKRLLTGGLCPPCVSVAAPP